MKKILLIIVNVIAIIAILSALSLIVDIFALSTIDEFAANMTSVSDVTYDNAVLIYQVAQGFIALINVVVGLAMLKIRKMIKKSM